MLKKAAVPKLELPVFVAEATSAESARKAGQGLYLTDPFEKPQGLILPFRQAQGMLFENSLIFLQLDSVTYVLMKRQNVLNNQQSPMQETLLHPVFLKDDWDSFLGSQ